MHKSLGNGVDPADIFNKYGADILRLWAASADYHADVRCSDAIFKQLSQNYLKFRNTARYCLGNLDGFDPNNLVAPADMLELDRWAVTRLNALIEKCDQAYNDYEFLVVTHAVNDFCVVELSNFYLDIIKDRLYCEKETSVARRAAQTTMYRILRGMTLLLAPVLSFTAEEIWGFMPHGAADDTESVFLNQMPEKSGLVADDAFTEKWNLIYQTRLDVNKMLEEKRNEKVIGKSLEAAVEIAVADDAAYAILSENRELLEKVLIVSSVTVTKTDAAENQYLITTAAGEKCERCWMYSTTVGEDKTHPTLCARCAHVISE